jgi:hypothetical protein
VYSDNVSRIEKGIGPRAVLSTPSDSMAGTRSALDVLGPNKMTASAYRDNDSDDAVNEIGPIVSSYTLKRGRKVASAWKYLSERDDSYLQ